MRLITTRRLRHILLAYLLTVPMQVVLFLGFRTFPLATTILVMLILGAYAVCALMPKSLREKPPKQHRCHFCR